MKYCPHCELEKDIKEFGRNRNRSDGLTSICKSCRKVYRNSPRIKAQEKSYRKEYYQRPEVRERANNYQNVRYKKDKMWRMKALENAKRYYINNRNYVLSHHKQYTIPESSKKRKYEWEKNYRKLPQVRLRILIRNHRRLARIRSLPNTFNINEWAWLLEQTKYRCIYCGKSDVKLVQEHVLPVSRGGPYTIENIVPSCEKCNIRKGNHTPDEVGMNFIFEINTNKYKENQSE